MVLPEANKQMSALSDTRFVYLSHTSTKAHAENYFSVLCLLHASQLSEDVDVVLYTDDTNYFADLPIEVRKIEDSLRQRAANGYRNKLKSLVMSDVADSGVRAMVYCDGDTWMRRHPARLVEMVTADDSVMHIPEVRLDKTSDSNKSRLRQVLEQSDVWADRDTGQRVEPTSWMCNSGVVGIHGDNFDLLQKAIDIGNQIHACDPTLFSVEQFSLGAALRTRTRVRFAESEVFHFWHPDVRNPFTAGIVEDVQRLRTMDLPRRAASAYAMRPRYRGRAWIKARAKKSAWAMGLVTRSVRSSV
jgi:hypothetical protein